MASRTPRWEPASWVRSTSSGDARRHPRRLWASRPAIATEADSDFAGPVPREGAVPAAEVIIDVSSAAGLSALIGRLSGQPLLIGTTGELPLAEIEAYGQTAPVAIVPNFSAGVPLLLELIQQAVAKMPDEWRVEIIEAHHDQKKDAPSGTAKRMQRAVTDAGGEANPTHTPSAPATPSASTRSGSRVRESAWSSSTSRHAGRSSQSAPCDGLHG